MTFPKLSNDSLKWAFIRGYFDGNGSISSPEALQTPIVTIETNASSKELLHEIGEFTKIPFQVPHGVEWCGSNALDFLSKLYDGSNYRLTRKYERYVDWAVWEPSIFVDEDKKKRLPLARVAKTCKEAVIPFKSRASDTGYDLTIIKQSKSLGPNTIMYDTGIQICPEWGYYVDVVPRSSLSKSGYILANSVGIIDRSYTGSIRVVLTKIDLTQPDLTFPFVGVQMIFRKVQHFEILEVASLEKTERSDGGFGSTNQKVAEEKIQTQPQPFKNIN